MASPNLDIDEIVRRVLLAVSGKPAQQGDEAERVSKVEEGGTAKPASGSPSDVLTLDTPVVALEQLRLRAGEIRHLVVRPGSLITPAARDALREHNIQVSVAARTDCRSGTAELAFGVADTRFNPESLSSMLNAKGIVAERIGATEVVSAVLEIVQRVRSGRKIGFLLTDKPFPALCLANRHPGVRAALANDVRTLRLAMESVGANLLVATAEGASTYQLARLIEQFVAAAPQDCPAPYRAQLEETVNSSSQT